MTDYYKDIYKCDKCHRVDCNCAKIKIDYSKKFGIDNHFQVVKASKFLFPIANTVYDTEKEALDAVPKFIKLKIKELSNKIKELKSLL